MTKVDNLLREVERGVKSVARTIHRTDPAMGVEDTEQYLRQRVCQGAEVYDESRGKWSSLAFSIMRFAILQTLRTDRRRKARIESASGLAGPYSECRGEVVDPCTSDECSLRDAVSSIMDRMDDTRRTLLRRRFWEGLSEREIARRMQISRQKCRMELTASLMEFGNLLRQVL